LEEVMPDVSLETKATLDLLSSLGVKEAACLTEAEIKALGDLTLNELKGLGKAQAALGPSGGGTCGGKIF